MKCICRSENCTSCGVCEKSCVTDNIFMKEKRNGFKFPLCRDDKCHSCDFVCPQNVELKESRSQHTYALQLKNDNELIESTSGGAFSAISQYVFDKGGVVYGAVYGDDLHVYHRCASKMAELQQMRGSK